MVPSRRSRGFSLLELMTVVAVLGIFAAIAMPGFQYLSHITKVKSASTTIYLALLKARSEAVKRNAPATLTPSTSGWQAGWTLTALDPTTGQPIVLLSQGELKGVIVTANLAPNTPVVYLNSGRIQGGTAPAFSITHSSAGDRTTAVARCVSAAPNGSPYVKSTAC